MIYILFILLVLMLYSAYFISGKEILSPWIILISMYILSTFVAMLNADYWNLDIKFTTVLVIILALLFFGLGEKCIKLLFKGKRGSHTLSEQPYGYSLLNDGKEINISGWVVLFLSCFMLLILYMYFQYTYKLSLLGGNPGGYNLMLKYARLAKRGLGVEFLTSRYLSHGLIISKCFAYFFIFVFLYNTVFHKFYLKNFKYLIPSVIYCGHVVLSSGRTQFIYLITTFIIILFVFWKKKNAWSIKLNSKILKYGFLAIILFLISFRLLGYLTGNSVKLSLSDALSIYIGSPIVGLDKYLQKPPPREFFGKETLISLYYILRKLGVNIPIYQRDLEFIYWTNGFTNIYTALRRYIQDYTIWGMFIIQFSLGTLYGGVLQYIKERKKIGIEILIYGMLFYPIVMSSIDDLALSEVLSTGTLFQLTYVILIYWWFIGRKEIEK